MTGSHRGGRALATTGGSDEAGLRAVRRADHRAHHRGAADLVVVATHHPFLRRDVRVGEQLQQRLRRRHPPQLLIQRRDIRRGRSALRCGAGVQPQLGDEIIDVGSVKPTGELDRAARGKISGAVDAQHGLACLHMQELGF